jgi:hypothetical protein
MCVKAKVGTGCRQHEKSDQDMNNVFELNFIINLMRKINYIVEFNTNS